MSDLLVRHHVQLSGSGAELLLFAHGFGCDQRLWRHLAAALAPSYRIALFDYAGSGRSDQAAYDEKRHASLEGYAEDLIEIAAFLGAPRVTVIAHSVSANIAILAARRRPELFDRLVLVCPSPCYLNHPPAYHGGFEPADIAGLLSLMEKNPLGWAGFLAPLVSPQPESGAEVHASFCALEPRVARQFAAATFQTDNRADLPHVRQPCLIIQCTDDVIAPLAVGRYMEARLPNARLHLLEARGHCPHLTHPRETAAAILEYLAATPL
ncbi:MAG: alpha/beta hydrolase [Opitutaceae bacterium]|jgi:sigma-B regulation protein RsbQ|nr:alpha/beta hydrolase [Opitutaceae bacterium]